MQCVQKYFENLPKWHNSKDKETKANGELCPSGKKTNVFLYCHYFSFYSQKVLMALYEKNIDFEPVLVNITKGEQYSSWFLEINPRGEIPVLKVDNDLIPDSMRILDYLDTHLDPESAPLVHVSSDSKAAANINRFRELLEALPSGVITLGSFFHPHLCGTPKLPYIWPVRELLKNADTNNSHTLRKLAEENPKAKDILLYKAQLWDRKNEILNNETKFLKVLNVVDQVLAEAEAQLQTQSEGNWLCSEYFSVADINLTILLHRLWELGFEDRFWAKGKRPHLESYYERAKQRDSFKKTVPNAAFQMKTIIMSQPPAYMGVAAAASMGVVLSTIYILKKLIC